MIKVCHFSSVHILHDPRVLYRECMSLASHGYDVSLVIQADKAEVMNGVKIVPLRKTKSRLRRMFLLSWSAFFKAMAVKADIYHFHDPELIPHGLLMRLLGKKVVFDVHENVHQQIRDKDWLPMRNLVAVCYRLFDRLASKAFYLVLAEHSYEAYYAQYKADAITVYNYPDISFFKSYINTRRYDLPDNEIFYSGGVFYNRGFDVIMKALAILKKRGFTFFFHCAGKYTNEYMQDLQAQPAYQEVKDRVKFYGYLPLTEGYAIAKRCKIGLAILRPVENYKRSYSTKNFEYMAIGLPTVTSNFELYTRIYDKYSCGLCVDPVNETELADAMERILTDKELAKVFSETGVKVSEATFNWDTEFLKITDLYTRILKKS
ncbi:MAG: glycosyltransferase [Bacteroidetes bacterium]|nr:glycosyltransferase [Bacteroidota bacterium]